jgi:N-acetylmuramoyl-L-alanine amidase
MNSNTKEHSNSIFILFALLFTITCIMFMYISNSFCKYLPMDVATEYKPATLPTIIIDAGHGGEDGGAVGADGTKEKNLNLDVARLLEALLRLNGASVVMTRTEDTLLYDYFNDLSDYTGHKKIYDLKNRLKITEREENPVYVGIHMNKFSDPQYKGLQVYYSPNDKRSELLAGRIQTEISTSLQKENKRVIKAADSGIYLLDALKTPAVLIECGFLSNKEECARLNDESYQRKLSVALFYAISTFEQSVTIPIEE